MSSSEKDIYKIKTSIDLDKLDQMTSNIFTHRSNCFDLQKKGNKKKLNMIFEFTEYKS